MTLILLLIPSIGPIGYTELSVCFRYKIDTFLKVLKRRFGIQEKSEGASLEVSDGIARSFWFEERKVSLDRDHRLLLIQEINGSLSNSVAD